MDTIIQQFGDKIKGNTKEFLENIAIENGESISDFVRLLRKDMDKLGRELCKYLIENLDEIIKESPNRKEKWDIVRKKDRKLVTTFGEIDFERRYYKSKFNGEYQHLADKKLGIGKYQRVDRGLEAEMVDLATDKSYAKVGNEIVNSLKISDQTVMNKIRKLEEIENNELNEVDIKKEVKCLYVEADEDHISLQNGDKAIPRLVYVYEGLEDKAGRKKLKNTYYFSGLYSNSQDLWLEVLDYIDANYKMDKIEKIFLLGDGARWIKSGLDWLPKSRYILDRYHILKYFRNATRYASDEVKNKLWEGIEQANKKMLKEGFSELIANTKSEKIKSKIRKTRFYFYNNWNGIKNYIEDKDAIGCSAEGHISHVLADRLSSRPMGWSKLGANQMSKLRAFKFNGGDKRKLEELFLNKQKKLKKENKLVEIESKIVTSKLKKKFAKPKSNVPSIKKGKITGLTRALKVMI